MKRSQRGSWSGLYVLAPMAVGLLMLVGAMKVGAIPRELMLVAASALVCGLALSWSRRHLDLMAGEGSDAEIQKEIVFSERLFIAGIDPARFQQGHTLQIVSVPGAPEPQPTADQRTRSR